ncbi:MAG: hypothetical protein WD469_14895 [Paenibacillaceae bacterium]
MVISYFENQDLILKRIIALMRLNGHSRMSMCKITGISRPYIDLILNANFPNPTIYNDQINKIKESFNLNDDYFLKEQTLSKTPVKSDNDSLNHEVDYVRTNRVKELFEGLENVLDIYSSILK